MQRITRWIASSPKFRLAVTLIGGVFPGILGNVYASQIAPDGLIVWSSLVSVPAFWPLLISVSLWLFLNLGFLGYDEDVARFKDDDYCLAYVRKMHIEAHARQVREAPDKASLTDAKALLKALNIK
jgi:hypothetical protein